MNDHLPSAVLRFWFGAGEEYGERQTRWFQKDASFDAEVRERFLPLYEELVAGAGREWLEQRADCLARIIALDQFPRHIFRGSPRAFAADRLALEAARHAIAKGYDRNMLPVERMFAYLPLEHSESLEDQLTACELTAPLAAFPQTEDAPRYALRHRDVIQRFGRFPHRNSALGRVSTPEEIEFLKQPGSRF
jgi:uncharacterized protein (DUF924 family)